MRTSTVKALVLLSLSPRPTEHVPASKAASKAAALSSSRSSSPTLAGQSADVSG